MKRDRKDKLFLCSSLVPEAVMPINSSASWMISLFVDSHNKGPRRLQQLQKLNPQKQHQLLSLNLCNHLQPRKPEPRVEEALKPVTKTQLAERHVIYPHPNLHQSYERNITRKWTHEFSLVFLMLFRKTCELRSYFEKKKNNSKSVIKDIV
jgi:hypothetical protein